MVVFKPNGQNIESFMLAKLLHRFQPNFAQWYRPSSARCGWSQWAPNKSKWRTTAILQKLLNRHISATVWGILMKFGSDAHWPLTSDLPLKCRIFEYLKWRQPPSWKSHKLRYLRNGLTDRYEILYADAKRVSYPIRSLKNLNFTNPRWRTAAILKTMKSPYLCNLLSDFD